MFFLSVALAHSPHDVVPLVSVATDGSVATLEDRAIALSADGWSVRWLGYPFRSPDCVFARGPDSVVAMVAGEGAWDSEDAGESWTFRGGPPDALRCVRAEDTLLVAGGAGAWSSPDGLDWSPLGPEQSLIDLTLDGDRALALGDDGALYELSEGAWLRLAEGPYRRLSAGEGVVLLAPEEGPIERLIGDTPTPISGAPTEVFALAAGDSWLAATADQAVWVSDDAGEHWTLESEGIEAPAEGSGAPGDGVHYAELVIGERWWLASWEGLFYRDPADARWSEVPLRTIPLVNTLHWLDDELLVGTNGGGLYRGVPGSADWTDVSTGIGWPWMRQLAVSPDGGAWFVGAGDVLYSSVDGGRRWTVPPVRLPTGGDLTLVSPGFAEDGRALFGGIDGEGRATVAWTADGGASWTHATLPGECGEKPGFGEMGFERARVSCGKELFLSEDGGQSWSLQGLLPAMSVGMIADGEAAWIATRAGLYHVDEGEPTIIDLEGEFLTAITALPDGQPLVAVRGRGLVGPDGTLPGWPAQEPVEVLAVGPQGQIALGSHLGLSLSTDGGQSFALACPYDRYDDHDQSWVWDGWAEQENSRAKAGDVHRGVAGSEATWTVEGEGLRVIGGAQSADLELELDGEPRRLEIRKVRFPGEIFAVNLPPGRHELRLRVLDGELTLDGGERWRWDAPELTVEEPEPERCGCRSGGAAALFGVFGTLRRRR